MTNDRDSFRAPTGNHATIPERIAVDYLVPVRFIVDFDVERIAVFSFATAWFTRSGAAARMASPATSPFGPARSEAEVAAKDELVAVLGSPDWELSHVYCPRCKRGRRLHGEPEANDEELLAGPPPTPRWECTG